MVKKPNQSLREYASYVDQALETKEMGILTSYYEQLLYNRQINHPRDKEWIELWKNFIKYVNENPRNKEKIK
jgi:hypothetical protein